MVKLYTFLLLIFLLLEFTMPIKAQNPFISKDNSKQSSTIHAPKNPFLSRIAALQRQLNQKMAALTRQTKETGSLRPLFSLIVITFVYGILHAAGPGHGKAVAVTYLLSTEKKPVRGILLGNLVALFHGLSGVVLVLAVHIVLKKTVTDSLQSLTRVTQLTSYSLILLFGTLLLIKSLISFPIKAESASAGIINHSKSNLRHPLVMAAAVGMIPCPGVVMVMLFCLSLNQTGLGLLLVLFLILGMAVTISTLGVSGVVSKNLILSVLERQPRKLKIVERGIEIVSAFMITALGVLFLAATI